MKRILSLLFILSVLLYACGQGSKSGDSSDQLSYDQTMALIFPDSSNVNEWHNAPIDKVAMSFVSLSNGSANRSCGQQVMLTNSGSQDVKATVSTVFPFTNSPWEVAKEYIVPAGASIHVGNNKVCHNGKGTDFAFKIQGASFNLED